MGKGGAIRWTDAELANFQAKKFPAQRINKIEDGPRPGGATVPAQTGTEKFQALGRMAKGRMNKTEAAYAQLLDAQKHDGIVREWKFHAIRVRLADRTFYEPDFIVVMADGEIQIREVKGSYTTPTGQMKVKMCAEVLNFFRIIKASRQKDGSWTYQEFNK